MLNWGDVSLKLSWATTRIEPGCEGSRAEERRDKFLSYALPDIHLYLKKREKLLYKDPGVKESRLHTIRMYAHFLCFLFAQASLN